MIITIFRNLQEVHGYDYNIPTSSFFFSPRWLKHIPETSDALRTHKKGGGAGLPPPYDQTTGATVQSKDSFESAGTPQGDIVHHSDLSDIKLKADAKTKRSQRTGSSASASPAGRRSSSERSHHYQNAEQQQQQQQQQRGSSVGASPARSKPHMRKGPLPPTPTSSSEMMMREDIMDKEHDYEDVPDQSDDEESRELPKQDHWNDDAGDENSSRTVDELDDDDPRKSFSGAGGGPASVATNNSNDTRTLTQQCSLVAPNEVHVTESPALIAEPVLSESGV